MREIGNWVATFALSEPHPRERLLRSMTISVSANFRDISRGTAPAFIPCPRPGVPVSVTSTMKLASKREVLSFLQRERWQGHIQIGD